MRNGLLRDSHPNPSRLLRRSRRALEEGELAKAERLYTECLQQEANSFDALHGLGQIHYRRGRLDRARLLMLVASAHMKSNLRGPLFTRTA